MGKSVIIFAILAFLCLSVMGQEEKTDSITHRFVNVTLGIPSDEVFEAFDCKACKKHTNNVTLGLLMPVSYKLHGIGAGVIAIFAREYTAGISGAIFANANGGNYDGIQLALLMNATQVRINGIQAGSFNGSEIINGIQAGAINGSFKVNGMQAGAMFSLANEQMNGLQAAAAYSKVEGKMNGLQAAAAYSKVEGKMNGVQIATHNWVDTIMNGAQVGIYNRTKEKINGIQIGIHNLTDEKMNGIQMGIRNLGKDIKGMQVGIFNTAQHVQGIQLGIINQSDYNQYPVGLVNIIKDGHNAAALTLDNAGNIASYYRSGGQGLYGIVGMGYNYNSSHNHTSIEGGIGAHLRLWSRFKIDTELTTSLFSKHSGGSVTAAPMYRQSVRLLPTYRFGSRIEVFGGPTLNYLYTKDMRNEHLFPSKYMHRKFTASALEEVYVGYIFGLQYKFR